MNKTEVFITIKAEILFPEGMVIQDAMDELFNITNISVDSTENVEVISVEIENITDELDWEQDDQDDEFYHAEYKGE